MGEKRKGGDEVNGRLFQTFAGVVKKDCPINGILAPADTPFLAMGLFVPSSNNPQLVIMLQGGIMGQVNISDVRIEMTDDMKKALAEVVLSS
jgi:hypothetical protein